jgi:DNA-damage-inducible protein J
MTKTANLNIRIDPETKKGAEQLFSNFGITISDAVTIFLKQSLMVGGLPFELKQPRYNATTEAAMQELLEKFRNGFIDIKEQIRTKAAEGYHFDFDVQKYLNGSMTEDDWQQFYKMEKQAWGSHVKEMGDRGKYGQP